MCFRNNDCLQYNNLPVPRTGSLLQFLVKTVSLVCSSHNYMAHFAINTCCATKAKAITLRLASSACNPHDKTISEHLYSQNAKPSTGRLCISTCLWSALGFHSFQLNFVNNHEWLSLCPATSKNSSTSRDAQTHTRRLLCVEKGLIYKLMHSLKTTFIQVIDFLYKEGGSLQGWLLARAKTSHSRLFWGESEPSWRHLQGLQAPGASRSWQGSDRKADWPTLLSDMQKRAYL